MLLQDFQAGQRNLLASGCRDCRNERIDLIEKLAQVSIKKYQRLRWETGGGFPEKGIFLNGWRRLGQAAQGGLQEDIAGGEEKEEGL